jgi:cysteine-rich repeat protein
MKFKSNHAALLLSLVCGLGGASACSSADSSEDEPGLRENVGVVSSEMRKGTPGALVGQGNYCDDPANLCSIGEGDCDSNAGCQAGLVCGRSKLIQFGFSGGDGCVPAHCINKRLDVGESQIDCGGECGTTCAPVVCKANGAGDRCTADCLCGAGQGDCDANAECQPGLVCGRSKLISYGFPAGDACVAAHCINKIKDVDETQVDCGGSCGSCAASGPACGDGTEDSQAVTSLVYTWLLTNCFGTVPVTFAINGNTAFALNEPETCSCTPGIKTQTVTTPSVLALLHGGTNQFSISANHTDLAFSWAKVTVNFVDGTSTALMIDEVNDGLAASEQPNLCNGGYQFERAATGHPLALTGEECDDGNVLNGDACNANCTLPN